MSLGAQSDLVLIVTLALYVLVPGFLLIKRWPLRAGLGMLLATFLPLFWQFAFTDSDAPGFVFLLVMMIPIPLGLIVIGLLYALHRVLVRKPRKSEFRPL